MVLDSNKLSERQPIPLTGSALARIISTESDYLPIAKSGEPITGQIKAKKGFLASHTPQFITDIDAHNSLELSWRKPIELPITADDRPITIQEAALTLKAIKDKVLSENIDEVDYLNYLLVSNTAFDSDYKMSEQIAILEGRIDSIQQLESKGLVTEKVAQTLKTLKQYIETYQLSISSDNADIRVNTQINEDSKNKLERVYSQSHVKNISEAERLRRATRAQHLHQVIASSSQAEEQFQLNLIVDTLKVIDDKNIIALMSKLKKEGVDLYTISKSLKHQFDSTQDHSSLKFAQGVVEIIRPITDLIYDLYEYDVIANSSTSTGVIRGEKANCAGNTRVINSVLSNFPELSISTASPIIGMYNQFYSHILPTFTWGDGSILVAIEEVIHESISGKNNSQSFFNIYQKERVVDFPNKNEFISIMSERYDENDALLVLQKGEVAKYKLINGGNIHKFLSLNKGRVNYSTNLANKLKDYSIFLFKNSQENLGHAHSLFKEAKQMAALSLVSNNDITSKLRFMGFLCSTTETDQADEEYFVEAKYSVDLFRELTKVNPLDVYSMFNYARMLHGLFARASTHNIPIYGIHAELKRTLLRIQQTIPIIKEQLREGEKGVSWCRRLEKQVIEYLQKSSMPTTYTEGVFSGNYHTINDSENDFQLSIIAQSLLDPNNSPTSAKIFDSKEAPSDLETAKKYLI